jgi:anti-sigma regulatory factor (Ser/Thr protein kinase)
VGLPFDWCHETRLAADVMSPARARAFVVHHLVEHRLLSVADHVRLVASELMTNAVVHAQTESIVTLSAREDVVTLTVEDAQPTHVPRVTSPTVLAEDGYGLRIVDLLSQSWGVSTDPSGAKLVWASFAASRHGPFIERIR